VDFEMLEEVIVAVEEFFALGEAAFEGWRKC
jgi:hypothetical protein